MKPNDTPPPADPPEANNAAGAGCMTRLVSHLIYGDIEEMPLSILGDNCPSAEYYNTLDREQQTRLAAAATVLAWSQGRLHPSGFLLANVKHIHHYPRGRKAKTRLIFKLPENIANSAAGSGWMMRFVRILVFSFCVLTMN
jgi:hypothetical protein